MAKEFELFDVSDYLLEELQSAGVITESFSNLQKNKNLLQEQMEILEEEEKSNPHQVVIKGVIIRWPTFKAVYTDYYNYPSTESVMAAFGLTDYADRESQAKALSRAVKHFMKNNPEGREVLVSPGQREKAYYKDTMPEPDIDEIEPGRRGQKKKSTRTIDALNNQDVVPGQFYNDVTRIPKSRWRGWIREWTKFLDRIKNPRTILGKKWKQYFIMGFQFERNLVIEIWYNSATSTFSVYDQNGGELGRPTQSLQESIRLFVTFLLRQYEGDAEIFAGRITQNQLSKSYMNAISKATYDDSIEAQREADLEARENINKGKIRKSIKTAIDHTNAQKDLGKEIESENDKGRFDYKQAMKNAAMQAQELGVDAVKSAMRAAAKEIDKERQKERMRKASKAEIEDFIRKQTEIAERVAKAKQQAKERNEKQAGGKLDSDKNRLEDRRQGGLPSPGSAGFVLENVEVPAEHYDFEEANNELDRDAIAVRKMAEQSPFTTSAIRSSVGDLLRSYDTSRVKKERRLDQLLKGEIFRGRKAKLVTPGANVSFFDRLRMAIKGIDYRADFVIGFSLRDEINIEVWYITEPDVNNPQKTISSFYVYDVTAQKLVRANLPYYRNAVQVVLAKIGVE